MLLPDSRLKNIPVMGLQTGTELARTAAAVIDPRKLEIVAYTLNGSQLNSDQALLRIADVRELSDLGMIVDSSDEFIATGDVVKLEEVYTLHFNPIGMPVIDERGHKLGKVEGYTLDSSSFLIQQLMIKRPFLHSLSDTQLLVHRTQITEINDNAIVVQSGAKKPEPVLEAVRTAYANPFRKAQTEPIDHE